MRRWPVMMVGAILALASAGAALAQGYPTRAITMIVPFPAGGATDTLARFLAEQMRGILGQPVIIENVAGAAGSLLDVFQLAGMNHRVDVFGGVLAAECGTLLREFFERRRP